MSRTMIATIAVGISLAVSVSLLTRQDDRVRVKTTTAIQGHFVQTTEHFGVVCYQNQPCIAQSSGKISQVNAVRDMPVKQGELLFRLDTSAEEVILGDLIGTFSSENFPDLADESVLAVLNQNNFRKLEQETKQKIQAAQIRAQSAGIMGEVYVTEGEWVNAGALLGLIHEPDKSIVVTLEYPHPYTNKQGCFFTHKEKQFNASVRKILPPQKSTAGEQVYQQLWLLPETPEALTSVEAGEKVIVEFVEEMRDNAVVAPLLALSSQNEIWYAQGGKAYSYKCEDLIHNGDFVLISEELADKRIILNPDELDLTEGCSVYEEKQK